MDFVAVILFLILYFVRPQDWIPGLEGLNVIKPIMAIGLWGLVTRDARSPRWRIMTTPHEWLMVAYLAYGCYSDPDWSGTFSAVLPVAGFYFLTGQALTDSERLDRYFRWWAGTVAFMCIVGVATDMGIDITKARELIDNQIGRLCLNTWLMDNPNALGHTAVTAFPLLYFTMIFRRGIASKILSVPLFILCALCVVATESKGAYLSAAVSITAALLVGRSRPVQIVLACLIFIGGSTVTSMLPRMVDREAMRYDEGIMGRALAFEAGRTQYVTGVTGGTASWPRSNGKAKPWTNQPTVRSCKSEQTLARPVSSCSFRFWSLPRDRRSR